MSCHDEIFDNVIPCLGNDFFPQLLCHHCDCVCLVEASSSVLLLLIVVALDVEDVS